MAQTEDRYRAPALDKGLDILELLAGIEGGLTQAEIAKRLGRSPNEFYRMLDRLARRGYVARVDGDRYALTLKLFGLAQMHAPPRRLASLVTPLMRDLAARTRQANQLVVFDRGHPVVVAQQEAPGYWGISIRVGSHIGLFDTGSGHVLLAFASPERRQAMVAENRDTGAPARDIPPALEARFEKIRAEGFEAMPSAQTAGVTNLSAPVLAPDGEAMAAVTIPYLPLVDRAEAPGVEEAVAALLETTTAMSGVTGHGTEDEGA
ncbi:IclR family transcriptional regulator [Roseisalinus antarcticus]|uniref:Putative HTH-type transcriptional regulator RhmR n=1 Tax=Roseisalinus antarcticus TaxID=254357 RepID=A0A1Y5TEY6_9RHOB|nr:IclR family transcriptional regulator [Roseisalinus antarcticus]SLN62678.1 putative HTH-type transcriptional regulator RhmR [Roseisalinus antarcticus]